MPLPKQLGPAQPRRDAGTSERDHEESQHNKPEPQGDPGRRIKGPASEPDEPSDKR